MLLLLTSLLVCFSNVSSFSSELLKRHCDLEMKQGVIMMGQAVGVSEDYIIRVFRQDIELKNGSMYYPNDRLLVTIEPTVRQFVLEVSGNSSSHFEDGKCEKLNRINTKNAVLIVNSDNHNPIIVNGVIAKSYSSGVKLVKPIIINGNSYEEL